MCSNEEEDKLNMERWIAKKWKKYQPYFQPEIDFTEMEVDEANREITKQILARNEYINWRNNYNKK